MSQEINLKNGKYSYIILPVKGEPYVLPRRFYKEENYKALQECVGGFFEPINGTLEFITKDIRWLIVKWILENRKCRIYCNETGRLSMDKNYNVLATKTVNIEKSQTNLGVTKSVSKWGVFGNICILVPNDPKLKTPIEKHTDKALRKLLTIPTFPLPDIFNYECSDPEYDLKPEWEGRVSFQNKLVHCLYEESTEQSDIWDSKTGELKYSWQSFVFIDYKNKNETKPTPEGKYCQLSHTELFLSNQYSIM